MHKSGPLGMTVWTLVLVGALNWGLIGLGYFANFDGNVVGQLLGTWPAVENIVYLLVGVAAVVCAIDCTKKH